MTPQEARAYCNYLLTLSIRNEEAFGPLALAFIKEHDLEQLGLLPEERFSLLLATAQALVHEPKRYTHKLELLQGAQALLVQTRFFDSELAQQLDHEIRKTKAELAIYHEAMRTPRAEGVGTQRLIVETDGPEYFLDLAQKRAMAYYQNKYRLTKEAKTAVLFGGVERKFDPENSAIHMEFPGACAPFMSARLNAFHLMLPFDLKISRKPDNPLEAGVRIFFAKMGYSFPLRYDKGKLCSYRDGQVLDIPLDDPYLLFVSCSFVKEPEFRTGKPEGGTDVPPEVGYPLAVLKRMVSLGPYIQIICNFKVWFDSSVLSLLILGAPDLFEYGLQGGSGLMTRTYASDRTQDYAKSFAEPWKEGLSYNFLNMHLLLSPGVDTAFVPYNTPLFTLYPVLNRQRYTVEASPTPAA